MTPSWHIRILGECQIVRADGSTCDLSAKSKRFAVLLFLAVPAPGRWVRRDVLLATFWPELDSVRARNALRVALHQLRKALGSHVIETRGDEEVMVDAAALKVDVTELLAALASDELASWLGRPSLELAPGLNVSDAAPFEQWLDDQRRSLRARLSEAAWHLVDRIEAAGDLRRALVVARAACQVSRDDEIGLRRLIALLDRAGDRAGALAEFTQFERWLQDEFQASPSPETLGLVTEMRERSIRIAPSETSATVRGGGPDETLADEKRDPVSPAETDQLPAAIPTRRGLASASAVVVLLSMGTAVAWLALMQTGLVQPLRNRPGEVAAASAAPRREVVVLPMEDGSPDRSLAYIATGIAQDVADRLTRVQGLDVLSLALTSAANMTHDDIVATAEHFPGSVILRTRLERSGDSLSISASLVDGPGTPRTVYARSVEASEVADAASRLTAAVAAAVLNVPLGGLPRSVEADVDPGSVRLSYLGWHRFFVERDAPVARELFDSAVKIDAGNARAWSGLSSVFGFLTTTGQIPFAEGVELVEAAAYKALALDSTQGSAWANLGFLGAQRDRGVDEGLTLIRRGAKFEPTNSEVLQLESTLYRFAWRWDEARESIRLARRLDPLSPNLLSHEADVEFCADRPEAAERLLRPELSMHPMRVEVLRGMTRALAMSGRYDEALDFWRRLALVQGDTSLANSLAGVHGATGYWSARHAEGTRSLAALNARSDERYVWSLHKVRARFASGDFDRGFQELDEEAERPYNEVYRVPCMAEFDEVRHDPRMVAFLERVGPLGAR